MDMFVVGIRSFPFGMGPFSGVNGELLVSGGAHGWMTHLDCRFIWFRADGEQGPTMVITWHIPCNHKKSYRPETSYFIYFGGGVEG